MYPGIWEQFRKDVKKEDRLLGPVLFYPILRRVTDLQDYDKITSKGERFMTVGERIRKELSRRQMTQKDLAKKLNVCESTVQKWVTDHNGVPADKLVDVSLALQTSVLSLLGLNSKNQDYELLETGNLIPSNAMLAWFDNPFHPIYSTDIIGAAFRYMALEYYLEHDNTLTENDRQDIYLEQSGILAMYPWQLDELLKVMRDFHQKGQLFVKDAIKLNKYELAFLYAELDFIDHISTLSEEELIRHVGISGRQPFSDGKERIKYNETK